MTEKRTLALIDIENLMGGPNPSAEVLELAVEFVDSLRCGDTLVVVAASHHTAARMAWHLPWVRWRWRSGPDGADHCLLSVLEHERVSERFQAVVLVSGDGIFAEPLAKLAMVGVDTTVMSAPPAFSRRLKMAAHRSIEFDLRSEVTSDAA